MAKTKRVVKPLPTIWRVPDELWEIIQSILDELDPPASRGRKRIDQRAAMDGIIYQMRTGCPWNALPGQFGDDSSVHRPFLRWVGLGVLDRVWAMLVESCEDLDGLDWQWQAADAAMGKARWGGSDRPQSDGPCENGVKRSLLVEADGGPLAVVIAVANVHDTTLLAATLDAVVVERPEPAGDSPQHLCLDKGYDNPTGRQAVEDRQYRPRIRRIGEEKLDARKRKRYPARRWVVERSLGWLGKCRAILVRYAKRSCVYLGLIKLACILLGYRRLHRLKGVLR